MRIVNVQGRKKTGKTTTVTNIIAELVRRGYSVGSIKSIHMDDFTMDSETADTGKHKKAGADPVTARCHGETNLMFKGKKSLKEVLAYYDTEWVVIESHVDLRCPNIITGKTAVYGGQGKDESLQEQVNDLTIACSGVIANEIDSFGELPVISSLTDIERLVDLIEDYYASPREINVRETCEDIALTEKNSFVRITAEGEEEEGQDTMLVEDTVEIFVNGKLAGRVPCTPEYVPELVIGWLRGEGYVDGIGEITDLEITQGKRRADVYILGNAPSGKVENVQSIPWKKEWIFELARDFNVIMPLREKTMAAHNCRLARGSDEGVEILFKSEDIGRHSVIDKTVGWAMRNGIDMRDCILFTSGRISRSMVQKTIRAGIPIMAGKGTISKKAVELAKEKGLTIIGYAREDSLCMFT